MNVVDKLSLAHPKGYLTIHATNSGYDYFIYSQDLREIEGGQFDNRSISIVDAAMNILKNTSDSCIEELLGVSEQEGGVLCT